MFPPKSHNPISMIKSEILSLAFMPMACVHYLATQIWPLYSVICTLLFTFATRYSGIS